MEKRDKLKKDYTSFLKRAQVSRVPEIQRSNETSKWSVQKNNQQNTNISNSLISPQVYVGHVKNLQKVFEDISSKDMVSQHVEPVKVKHAPDREKDHVSNEEISIAGHHGPVFSQVYNPLKKVHLEKRNEHATISVIDSTGKLHQCIITENYMDTNEEVIETNDSFDKDFIETQIQSSYHKDRETFQRHSRPTLQELQLTPRTPTPPPQKIKNNVSISLGSPKGWKNESAVIRPTKHFIGQRFENQKDTDQMLAKSSNVFFAEDSFSNSITDLELQQKEEQTNRNRLIHSPKEMKDPNTRGKSQEEYRTKIASNMLHDESPLVSAKEKLDENKNEKDLTLLKNEIQAEYEAHEDSGQTAEIKSKISDLQFEHKCKRESNILDLEKQGKLAKEPITSYNQPIKCNNVTFPVRSQKNRPSYYTSSVQVSQKQIFPKKKDKVVAHIIKGTVDDGTSTIFSGTAIKSTAHKLIQSRYPAKIIKTFENNVNLDADPLNQNKETERKPSAAQMPPKNKQVLKNTISEKGLSSIQQKVESKHTHDTVTAMSTSSTAYGEKALEFDDSHLNQGNKKTENIVSETSSSKQATQISTTYDDKAPDFVDGQLNQGNRKTEINISEISFIRKQALRYTVSEKEPSPVPQNEQMKCTNEVVPKTSTQSATNENKSLGFNIETMKSHSEDKSFSEIKQTSTMKSEMEISTRQNLNYELKQSSGGIKEDSIMVKGENVDASSEVYLESADNDFFKGSSSQSPTEVVNENVNMENQTVPEVITIVSSSNSSDQLLNKVNNMEGLMISVITAEERNKTLSNLLNGSHVYKHTHDITNDQNKDTKAPSSDTNNCSKHKIVAPLTSATDSCDSEVYKVQSVINKDKNGIVASKRDDILENVTDLQVKGHKREPASNRNESSIEDVSLKRKDIKNTIGEDCTGLNGTLVNSNKQMGDKNNEEPKNTLADVQDMCNQNINADSLLSGETTGLKAHMNLDENTENNAVSVETKEEPEEKFIPTVENRGVEENVIDIHELNKQKTILSVNLSTEFRDQPFEQLNEVCKDEIRKESSVTFLQEENGNKVEFTTNANINENLDVEHINKNIKNNIYNTKAVDESVPDKLGLVEENEEDSGQTTDQVVGLMSVAPIAALQELTRHQTFGQTTNENIKQCLDQVISAQKHGEPTEMIPASEKTEKDSHDWTPAVDHAMGEHENVTVENCERLMGLDIGQRNRDQTYITNDVEGHCINHFSANDTLEELSEKIEVVTLQGDQEKRVIQDREHALDSALETGTLGTDKLSYEVNQTNQQVQQTIDITGTIEKHPQDNQLMENSGNTVADRQLENDETVLPNQFLPGAVDEKRESLHGVVKQSYLPLPELKTIDIQENVYEHCTDYSKSTAPVESSEPFGVQNSYLGDVNYTKNKTSVSMESDIGLDLCKLNWLNDNLQTNKDIADISCNTAIKKNDALHVEEEESSENMDSWVNKLRQLETPEFLKYQKPRRQPHSTPHFIYTTLPPIKEDQDSPKCDQPYFNWQLQEKEETLKAIVVPNENNSALEKKVEQSEESPKYSWERTPDRITNRSSPLELMRKHSGDESSRSENYKALITQSLSQRQSSIIGSLLSDRLDRKSETTEGKSFSRLESSLLLSSYLKPKKDIQKETTEQTKTMPSNSTNSHIASDPGGTGDNSAIVSLTVTSEVNTANDSLNNASGGNTVIASLACASEDNKSESLTNAPEANTFTDSFSNATKGNQASNPSTSESRTNTASDSLSNASGENAESECLTNASEANIASDFLPSVSEANTESKSTNSMEANIASDSLPNVSRANTASQSTNALEANIASDSLPSVLRANTESQSTNALETNIASDSLPSVLRANTTSQSTNALEANIASDSSASIAGANTASQSTNALEANIASGSLPSVSRANTESQSTNASEANIASDSLASISGANKASQSTNALEANIASDSLPSVSQENTASQSTNASEANIGSDSFSSVSGANTTSILTDASKAHTASGSFTKASGENAGSESLTNVSRKNKANDSLNSVLGANTASESKNALDTNTASESLTVSSEENTDNDSLTGASAANTVHNRLTNVLGANKVSGILSNASGVQKPEDKEFSTQLQNDNIPCSDSNIFPSKLEPSVASSCKVFPDVWHHPEKNRGKLNPRPGKIILFSEPGFKGHRHEIYSDVCNMTDWELEGTVSVRIVRGGWLLYEKPQFRGKRVMLTEGDTDLSCPWEVQDATSEKLSVNTRKPKFWIGSLRHVVRDFQVPRISLFMEENGEGNKVTIIGATPDLRVHGHPTKTESIIVHSGQWLVYNKPFFEGDPYILEPGGYPNRKAWNGQDSNLYSLQPAQIGGATVEKPNEPKILLFKYPGFEGPIWDVSKDLNSLQDELNIKGECLLTVGSIRVLGGCWVGYEKEGFHGHQYLLEEGEYKDWSAWGGYSEELGSLRHIRTDFAEPEIVLYKVPDCSDGTCLRLNEALSDIELAQYGTKTESIHVLNGVWVAYENVDFSGEQYILEKGIYNSYQDWGAKDSQICSVQPVLQVGIKSLQYSPKIQLFSEPNFHGDCMTFAEDHSSIPESPSLQSCRVEGGSWILYEDELYHGEQYILSEGDYPTRTAMGCLGFSTIRSLKKVPLYFSIPSISLHGLEKFEGKELNFTGEVRSLQGEGYNNHVLSVRVKSGLWVLYEHSDFRGRQWFLKRTQIPNWLLYSGLQRIGSLCPIRQRRVYFRLRNRVLGLFLCVLEPSEDMKAARVQLSEPQEGSCDFWFYEEGRIKNQLVPHMSLQVVSTGNQGTKVVLWSEGRKPVQTWTIEDSGYIVSCLFKGLCLDIKGGHSYDSNHVVVLEVSENRPTQRWDLMMY
ncbi:beta/gamma crystallin domain-containing protein 2 isoform X2 [Pyxicephalus adspersus]